MDAQPFTLLINSNPWTSDNISLGYIAAYLRAKGFAAQVIDLAYRASPQLLADIVRDQSPLLIGLSTHQITIENTLVLSRWFKQICDAKIVLGGPQIPAMPAEALADLAPVDFLCRGEGELVVHDLLRHLSGELSVEQVPGLAYRTADGQVRATANPTVPDDLDVYPSPYLSGVLPPMLGHQARLLTSRGCPYRCSFCVTPFFSERSIRCHSIDRVVDEIAYLAKVGQRDLWIADPLFLAKKKRVEEIFERIIAAGLDVSIWLETRANLVDHELAVLMRRAGVRRVAFGLESSNQEALDRMKKDQTIDQFTNSVRIVKEHGIGVDLLHIVGGPDDTLDSCLKNIDYVRRMGNYLDGYNSGNEYALYFGSEATRDPGAAGLVVDSQARSPEWPRFLSPGVYVQPASFKPGDKQKVLSRILNETDLAGVARVFEALVENGLPEAEAAALPLPKLRDVEHISFAGRMDLCVIGTGRLVKPSQGPYEVAQISRRSPAGPVDREQVMSVLRNLTFAFQLNLIDRWDCLLFDDALVDALIDLLTPPVLHRPRIVFNISPRVLADNGERLQSVLSRFIVLHESIGGGRHKKPLARMSALLDLTNETAPVSVRSIDVAAAGLLRSSVRLFPFFRFESPADTERYGQVVAAVGDDEGANHLMVGSIAPAAHQAVHESYRTRTEGRRLPPMFDMASNTLLLHREDWTPMEMGAHLIVWSDDWQRRREDVRDVHMFEVEV